MNSHVILYSTKTCNDCIRIKYWLRKHAVNFTEYYLDEDETYVEKVLQITQGDTRIPVLVFPDDSVLIEPSSEELEKHFSEI